MLRSLPRSTRVPRCVVRRYASSNVGKKASVGKPFIASSGIQGAKPQPAGGAGKQTVVPETQKSRMWPWVIGLGAVGVGAYKYLRPEDFDTKLEQLRSLPATLSQQKQKTAQQKQQNEKDFKEIRENKPSLSDFAEETKDSKKKILELQTQTVEKDEAQHAQDIMQTVDGSVDTTVHEILPPSEGHTLGGGGEVQKRDLKVCLRKRAPS
eukprot:TRINITY_DN5712_c0_g1_i1.p1 TRINITY_DN5712_c0_g1~~TRINITY_DN5712_c0_g1_i1.p1  ORF type:complete len:209 (-),score=27.44 TRINITY_DN5712_c0_g1_i1:88-714(-)